METKVLSFGQQPPHPPLDESLGHMKKTLIFSDCQMTFETHDYIENTLDFLSHCLKTCLICTLVFSWIVHLELTDKFASGLLRGDENATLNNA